MNLWAEMKICPSVTFPFWRILKVPKLLGLLMSQKEVALHGISVHKSMFFEQPCRKNASRLIHSIFSWY